MLNAVRSLTTSRRLSRSSFPPFYPVVFGHTVVYAVIYGCHVLQLYQLIIVLLRLRQFFVCPSCGGYEV